MDHKAFNRILNISKQITIVVTAILIINPVLSTKTMNQQQQQKPPQDEESSLQKELEQVDDTQVPKDDTYVRQETMDNFDNLTLTPYWDIDMGTGETVLVDCGVYTAGKPDIYPHWIKPDGTIIHENNTDDRIRITELTTNHPQYTKKAAYTVLILSIANLTLDDTGHYKCQAVDQSTEKDTKTAETSIKINVIDSNYLCGFESPALCGWTNSTPTSWRYHTGDDEESINTTKLRHDHTYGSSKHHGIYGNPCNKCNSTDTVSIQVPKGHMLSVDTQRDSIHKQTSLGLKSPLLPAHDKDKCFEFWHICSGNIDEMRVSVHFPINSRAIDQNKFSKTLPVHVDKEWHRSFFTIPPQSLGYHILVEVDICKGTKCKATVALDDFRVHEGSCGENNSTLIDKRLKVRLVNGSTPRQGRLEVLHDGKWGTVCSKSFGKNDSRVVCRMLNFSTEDPIMKRRAEFGRGQVDKGAGEYMIWMERLACDGDEADLGSCMSKGEMWADHNCSHDLDVAVICNEPVKPTPTASPSPTTTTSTSTTTQSTTPSSTSSTTTSVATPAPTVTKSTTPKPKSSTTTTARTEGAVPTAGLPLYHSTSSRSHTGAAGGIIVALIIIALVSGIYCYKRKKYGHKSKYIVFSNPKYHKDNLPGNDISMDSPLTSSSLSILA